MSHTDLKFSDCDCFERLWAPCSLPNRWMANKRVANIGALFRFGWKFMGWFRLVYSIYQADSKAEAISASVCVLENRHARVPT